MSYDNIIFTIAYEFISSGHLEGVAKRVGNVKEITDTETGCQVLSGQSNGVRFYFTMDKIKVSGSMPRLIRGNNLYPIIANEIGQLAEKIALLLDIPIEPVLKAKILEFDFSVDLFLEKKPKEYFDVLGPYSRLERIPNNNSLYYNNTNQENCFYDKIRCSLDKGIPTPEEWKAKNILRSERTYKSKMIHGLCYDCEYDYLSLERLSERRLCAMLIDEWYEFYTGIVKTNPVYLDFKNAESPKDILNNFIAVTVDFYGGYESVIKMIDIGSRLSPFKHTKYSTRLKTMVKAIITNKRFLKESEYLTELDNAFKRKGVEFYDELHLYMLTRLQSTLKNSENFDRIDSFTVLDSVILWMKGEKKFEELIPYFFE